ncbi:MAG: M20/M25/M40 family metallo-hydrolase [Candidatus Angelobacter sp.]
MNMQAVSRATMNSRDEAWWPSLMVWAILAALVALAVLELKAPNPVPATAPAGEFSAAKALVQVQVISRTSHPLGSNANTAVREYLVAQLSALGMYPQVVQAVGINNGNRRLVIGNTHDIVGRLPGSANSRAIMLVAHYDSVSNGPGAGDDGAAVAAILETVRALRAGPSLKNDLVVLFTDGEESGLLGAEALVSSQPWFKDLGLIMNFEGRGDQGPSLLFETSPRNAPLIAAVSRSAPHAIGSSFFYALYKLLPNDTDFTIFRQHEIPGLNFAYGNNLQAYHSRLDTVGNLSAASLQHHGSYALSLARDFGQRDLTQLKGSADDIFFDLLGSSFIAYSEAWVLPGEILVTLLLGCTIVLAVRRSEVEISRILLALLPALAFLLLIPAVIGGATWLLVQTFGERLVMGDSQSNLYILIGLILGGMCAGIALLMTFSRRFSLRELSLAGLIIVAVLSWLVAVVLPGGSYLLFWPLLLVTVGFLVLELTRTAEQTSAQRLANLAGAVMAVFLFAPLSYLLYIFLTLQWTTIAAIGLLLGLFCILCVPLLDMSVPPDRGRTTITLFLVCSVASLAVGTALSHHGKEHPRRDTIIYSLNADEHAAVWATHDNSLDHWTAQFFSKSAPQRQPIPNYLAGAQRVELSAPASTLDLMPPIAEIRSHQENGGRDTIRMNVRSQRNATAFLLTFEKDIRPVAVKVGGRDIVPHQDGRFFRMVLLGVEPGGIDLEFTLEAPSSVSFWLADSTSGLPAGVSPRPDDVMANEGSDVMLVCRKYSL